MDDQETVTSHSSVSQTRTKSDNESYISSRCYSPQNSWREHTSPSHDYCVCVADVRLLCLRSFNNLSLRLYSQDIFIIVAR